MFEETVYSQGTLYVPKGCYNAFSKHKDWGHFSNIVESSFKNGDVNLDEEVNTTDLTTLVNHLLNVQSVPPFTADVNADDITNVSDVTELVSLILAQ
ncbi:MAG: dockerin type I domain-containing protein [Sodaliphilus sp.]